MSKMEKVAAGLALLAQYQSQDESQGIAAEHDVIYAGPDEAEEVVSQDHQQQLDELGWFVSEEFGCYQIFV